MTATLKTAEKAGRKGLLGRKVGMTQIFDASGAVVQTWRPGHWASWMYTVGAATFDAASGVTDFQFDAGGFQGSRGEDAGEDTYIENVFEELDAPSEWFFNTTTRKLYLFWNASAGTPPPASRGSRGRGSRRTLSEPFFRPA